MEFFNKGKAIKLISHHNKYLIADQDQETVRQSHYGASDSARWDVELVPGHHHVIRLKSCYGKYLTACDEPFLLGMTGKKVMQTCPSNDNLGIEWEPIKDGFYVKLRAKGGKFLRANSGPPPWRNSVTHGVSNRTVSQNWILWSVEIVDAENEHVNLNDSLSHAQTFSSFAGSDYESHMAPCRSSSCGPCRPNETIKGCK